MNKIKITFAPRYSGFPVQSRGYVSYRDNTVYLTRRQLSAILRRCRAIGGDSITAFDADDHGRELEIFIVR